MSEIYYEGRKYFDKEDYAKSYELYSQGDKEGDVYCSFGLAQQLAKGYGIDKNEPLANSIFERVFPVLKAMAEAGDDLAQIMVCIAYYVGYAVKKNYKKAIYWCKKAAEQGNALAQAGLAFRYENGLGIEKSIEKAIYWYEKAIEGGNNQAIVNLADIYYLGKNIEQDYEQAIYWYSKAVDADNSNAILGLTAIAGKYLFGDGVEPDHKRAFSLYSKAAQKGNAIAEFRLGNMYNAGMGTEQNYEKAVYWYKKAMDNGYSHAAACLADMYYNGRGVEQDYEMAVLLYSEAAANGCGGAYRGLGRLYEEGNGVEKSLEKAVDLYEKGFYAKECCADCAYVLGLKYEDGEGVEQSLKTAVLWYRRGAKKGSAFAQEKLGELYLYGRGVKRNVEKANYWFKQALKCHEENAEFGDSSSMYQAAKMWRDGRGCDANPERAKFWYKKYVDSILPLATKGDIKAQRGLGYAYQWGFVKQSFQKAEYWYNKASLQGDEIAKLWLAEIYRDGALGRREIKKAITLFQELKNFSAIGEIYAYGNGVEVNFNMAELWFKKGVENGEAQACYCLAELYREYKRSDKYSESIRLLESIVEDEIWGSTAYQTLAEYYNEGLGVDKDPQKAKELNRKAFEFEKQHYGMASYNYFDGLGTKKNYKKAFNEFLQFPNFGLNQYYIGLCYAEGKGVPKDIALAKKWYEKAANQGVQQAILALGEMYYFGRGVEQDYSKAVQLFECSTEVRSYALPNYYLGDCYHHGLGVKSDWYKAKEYYKKAIELGYNCEYALEMVRIDLGEFRKITKMETYARDLVSLNLSSEELKERITQDLKNDFGDSWENLKYNAKVGLITGVLTYVTFISMGDEFCKQLDFSAVIVNFAKALEVELAEYFYKGYISYLKKKKVSATVFPANSVFLKITEEGNEEIGREYQDESEIKNFKLGGLRYILDDKFEIMPSREAAMQATTPSGRSEVYRRRQLGYKDNVKYGIRTIDKHMVAYANELFDKDAFSATNRKKDIVNYLIDLSSSVGEIAYQYRNPAAHGDVMDMQKASFCGDYVIKVRKLMYGFLSKIKKKYRNGYVGS